MRIGTIDRRVALQRKGQSYSNTGEPVESWSTLVTRWASMRPLNGVERSTAAQWVAREQVQFIVRWTEDIADLSPLDRIVFPAGDGSSSPVASRSIYDIMAVLEQGRHDTFQIMAARRAA